MTRILIAGIGGVGGYFGGKLAAYHHNSPDVEISFLARGENLNQIRNHGLQVIERNGSFIARPRIASDNISDFGLVDLILICTKSYDLEAVAEQLRPAVHPGTIILPLLNGVDSKARLAALYPHNIVLDGCVYIVSRLTQPGVIENTGLTQTLSFGKQGETNEGLLSIEKQFKDAGIEATLSPQILSIIWQKFIFLSPTATATSFYNKSIGELLSDTTCMASLLALIHEILSIARANGISIPEDIVDQTLHKLRSLPYEATSSMHSDFRMSRPRTELPSLTGNIIEEGLKLHIDTPTYSMMYRRLGGIV